MKYLGNTILFIVLLTALYGCGKGKAEWKDVQKLESYTTNRLNKVYFADSKTGFVVGGNRFLEADILTTHDGGNTWSFASLPEAGKILNSITMSTSGRLVAVGIDGKTLISGDTGRTWKFTQLNPWYTYKDVFVKSDNSALITGGHSFNSGMLTRTDTNGNSTGYDSISIEINKIEMQDNMEGYLACFGTVKKTTDGGLTWKFLDVKNDNFTGISVHNRTKIWICGIAGSIYYSPDAGTTWQKQRNGNAIANKNYALKDILFQDETTGWAVGEKGLVIRTTDGGKNWKEYRKFTNDALHDICVAPDGSFIVCGDNGALYKLSPL